MGPYLTAISIGILILYIIDALTDTRKPNKKQATKKNS
jgi:hypothetical protein